MRDITFLFFAYSVIRSVTSSYLYARYLLSVVDKIFVLGIINELWLAGLAQI